MRSKRSMHRNMFALVGWLFADMFLAMTMIFLIASTIGTPIADASEPIIPVNITITATPHLIGMDKVPVFVHFSINSDDLLADDPDPAVTRQVWSQVQNQLKGYLNKHIDGKAAFVLTFGGGRDDDLDKAEAQHVNKILQDMGRQQHYVFDRNDTVYTNYIDRSANAGDIEIEIFFYLYTQ